MFPLLLLLFVIIIMIARQATYIKGHPIFTRDVLFLFSKVYQFLNIENTTTTMHSKQPPTVNMYCLCQHTNHQLTDYQHTNRQSTANAYSNATNSIHQYDFQSTVFSNILATRVQ